MHSSHHYHGEEGLAIFIIQASHMTGVQTAAVCLHVWHDRVPEEWVFRPRHPADSLPQQTLPERLE